jgi:Pyridine nucleotide-disulphide oxidoreductase, dimerisation domain
VRSRIETLILRPASVEIRSRIHNLPDINDIAYQLSSAAMMEKDCVGSVRSKLSARSAPRAATSDALARADPDWLSRLITRRLAPENWPAARKKRPEDGQPTGFCKLIVETERRQIVGAHVLGEYSAEVIQMVAACMAAGMRVEEVAELQLAFPTFTEGVGMAAQMLIRELGVRAMPQLWSSLSAPEVDASPGRMRWKATQ